MACRLGDGGSYQWGELIMNAKQEARLIRRMLHLRSMMRFTKETLIVVTLNEFIAATETELVSLKPDRMRKVTFH
jgi:hypothetical protein